MKMVMTSKLSLTNYGKSNVVYLVSLFLGDNSLELNRFSRNVIIPLNLIMGVAVPTVIFIISHI